MLERKQRVVIVAQHSSALYRARDWIKVLLEEHFESPTRAGLRMLFCDGNTPPFLRDEFVDAFSTPKEKNNVMIGFLSTGVGGTGLSL